MHKNILNKEQVNLLPIVSEFSKDFYLVGGTAIALYLGHRNSIDFDLFTKKKIKRKAIKNMLDQKNIDYSLIHEAYDQFHILIAGVKFTFFNFPFSVKHQERFEEFINMPALLDLAAMKSYALGGRAKWKDYVDLYFIMKHTYSRNKIEDKAEEIFEDKFNKKLFRQQLAYFTDIDYSEPIQWIIESPPSDEKIKSFLIQQAIQEF